MSPKKCYCFCFFKSKNNKQDCSVDCLQLGTQFVKLFYCYYVAAVITLWLVIWLYSVFQSYSPIQDFLGNTTSALSLTQIKLVPGVSNGK